MKQRYNEKLVEDFIKEYPQEFLGEDLRFVARQITLDGFRPDLVFADRNDDRVVVEVQLEALDRYHFYKILEYRDLLLERDNARKVRTILFCNKLPSRYAKLLKTHDVRAVVMTKDDFLVRACKLNPELSIAGFDASRKPIITAQNILSLLESPREFGTSVPPAKVEDAVVFWERSWESSGEDHTWLSLNLDRGTNENLTGVRSESSGLHVPLEIVVSRNILDLGRERWGALNIFVDLLMRRYCRETSDSEIILGWRHQDDAYNYEHYISGSVTWFMGLCETYRKGRSIGYPEGISYDMAKITADLSVFAQIKIYIGRYPSYEAVAMFDGFEVAKGPGSLEIITSPHDKEWLQKQGFESRAEYYAASPFGKYEWATVHLLNVNRQFLWKMSHFLDHMSHHNVFCKDRAVLDAKCPRCLTTPKLLKGVNPLWLELSARYFQHWTTDR